MVEVSSFQLERAPTFRPEVSLLLNITDDHLDRYASFADYADAKGNAFVNQNPATWPLPPLATPRSRGKCAAARARLCFFGASGDYVVRDGSVVEASSGQVYPLAQTALSGGTTN